MTCVATWRVGRSCAVEHGDRAFLAMVPPYPWPSAAAALLALTTWSGSRPTATSVRRALRSPFRRRGQRTSRRSSTASRLSPVADWRLRAAPRLGESTRERLHASLALLPVDASQADYLATRCSAPRRPSCSALYCAGAAPSPAFPMLWTELKKACGRSQLADFRRGPASYDPTACAGRSSAARWPSLWSRSIPPSSASRSMRWSVRGRLAVPLERIFVNNSSETEHDLPPASSSITPPTPAPLRPPAHGHRFQVFLAFFPIAARLAAKNVPLLQAQLPKSNAAREAEADTEQAKDELAERQARAAVALVRLGHSGDVWPLLRHSADPPLSLSILFWLSPVALTRKRYSRTRQLNSPASPDETRATRQMDAILFDSRDLDAASAHPGPGHVWDRSYSLPANASPWSPGSSTLYEHDLGCRHSWRIGLDLAAVEAAPETRDDRRPLEGQGPRRPPLVRQ